MNRYSIHLLLRCLPPINLPHCHLCSIISPLKLSFHSISFRLTILALLYPFKSARPSIFFSLSLATIHSFAHHLTDHIFSHSSSAILSSPASSSPTQRYASNSAFHLHLLRLVSLSGRRLFSSFILHPRRRHHFILVCRGGSPSSTTETTDFTLLHPLSLLLLRRFLLLLLYPFNNRGSGCWRGLQRLFTPNLLLFSSVGGDSHVRQTHATHFWPIYL